MANNDLGNQLSILTQMKDLLGNIPSAYDQATEAAGRQSQALQELASSMEEATDPSGIQDMNSAMEELASETEKTSGSFGSFGKKAGMGAAQDILQCIRAFERVDECLLPTFKIMATP